MASLESDPICTRGSYLQETPVALNAEVDQQDVEKNNEETTAVLHPMEGCQHDIEGNFTKETPGVTHSLDVSRQNSPGINMEGTANVSGEDNRIPCIGMKFGSEDEAYNFYNEYAARVGFSIRKAKVRYTSTGVIRQRYYYCSKQGLSLDDRDGLVPVRDNKLHTRTDCKAQICFGVMDGIWEVTQFNPDHNHELAHPQQRKFLRSYRKVLETRSITPKKSHDVDNQEDGGDVDVIVPSIGMKLRSEEEAYNLYNKYAAHVGFSIRRSKCSYTSRGVLRQRYYVCTKQGLREFDESYGEKKINRVTERTGCNASIRFKVIDNVWEVIYFNPNHNHELVAPEQRKALRSMWKLSEPDLVSMGIRSRRTFSDSTEVRKADNFGSLRPDYHNLLHGKCSSMIESGDTQSLCNYFKHKQLEDAMFFYAVKVASDNHVVGFFWRDGRSGIDYDTFSDVVIFDTTLRTKKYNLICAPFVGVNHHGKNVMFGCAILLKETVETLTWLFETFLELMHNQHPKTIFTNQCQAIADSIRKVFPKTRHLLSLCNIAKHAKKNLLRFHADSEFKRLFWKCVGGCSTKEEFHSAWNELTETFGLADNKWLKALYDLREKWCPAFSLDTFSANLRLSESIEDIHDDIQFIPCKPTDIEEFLCQYEDATKKMRLAELEDDIGSNNRQPSIVSRSSGILMQAADVYTIEIFELFQKEMVESLSIVMKELKTDGTLSTYELTEEGHNVGHVLNFNSDNCTAACDCKMFESMGILCRHALRVLNMRSVTKIPSQYILKRWTKGARKEMVTPVRDESSPSTRDPSFLRRRLIHKALCAVDQSLLTPGGFEMADALLGQIIEQADRQTSTLNFVEDNDREDKESNYNVSIDDTSKQGEQKEATTSTAEINRGKKRKRAVSKSTHLQSPLTSFFPRPQIPAFFHLPFDPRRDGTVSNLYVLPSGLQAQAAVQMPHTNQNNSASCNRNRTARLQPIYPKINSSYTVGPIPYVPRGSLYTYSSTKVNRHVGSHTEDRMKKASEVRTGTKPATYTNKWIKTYSPFRSNGLHDDTKE